MMQMLTMFRSKRSTPPEAARVEPALIDVTPVDAVADSGRCQAYLTDADVVAAHAAELSARLISAYDGVEITVGEMAAEYVDLVAQHGWREARWDLVLAAMPIGFMVGPRSSGLADRPRRGAPAVPTATSPMIAPRNGLLAMTAEDLAATLLRHLQAEGYGGRRIWAHEITGEYERMCEALGVEPLAWNSVAAELRRTLTPDAKPYGYWTDPETGTQTRRRVWSIPAGVVETRRVAA
jgi:hypothetical protein